MPIFPKDLQNCHLDTPFCLFFLLHILISSLLSIVLLMCYFIVHVDKFANNIHNEKLNLFVQLRSVLLIILNKIVQHE